MSGHAASANGPVVVDRQVAQLPGEPVGAAQKSAVTHDSAADAGRHGHVDEVRLSTRGPELAFREHRHLRVALHHGRKADSVSYCLREREIPQASIEVGRCQDHAAERIERARR